ncbi:PREDICTED: U-box domain-containing protein 26-like [Nelumbo nucifera]|uniref:U-box domain-containing protein n=2 Tax=Nelumbo nucifera TaxID=4432 RepID=A0A1U8A0P1_NELNU|nr:PREDICTED: U-box domain-containing protein 26-like [Nelumbo nucifera]DAD22687.1 TPA_asm: hypothetical protein HUJ06_024150 [Nelumbo nucifera]
MLSSMKDDQMAIPHLFRCPISLDLFTDPVTLCTGQTYDRSSIEKWLAAGNLTCPVTMQRLHDPSLVPNHTLRHLIDQWLCMDHSFDPDYLKTIDPDLSLTTLKHKLESQEVTLATKIGAVGKLEVLSKDLAWRSGLIQLNFFPLILRLFFVKFTQQANLDQEDSELAEGALTCILNMFPFSKLCSLNMLKEDSNLASFLVLLDHGTAKIKTSLCHLVGLIASSSETRDLCVVFGQNPKILRGLITLLHQNSEASNAAVKAISALCYLELNQENVVTEGGVDGLIAYISGTNISQSSMALATLELLLGLESGKKAAVNNPSTVHALVKMVFRVSDHEGSENAVGSLLIICYDSLKVREEAISAGVLTQLLLLLQSQCSCRSKNKARVLLKLLRSMWAESPSASAVWPS